MGPKEIGRVCRTDPVGRHLRRIGASDQEVAAGQDRARDWLEDHDVDTNAGIRRIRTAA